MDVEGLKGYCGANRALHWLRIFVKEFCIWVVKDATICFVCLCILSSISITRCWTTSRSDFISYWIINWIELSIALGTSWTNLPGKKGLGESTNSRCWDISLGFVDSWSRTWRSSTDGCSWTKIGSGGSMEAFRCVPRTSSAPNW